MRILNTLLLTATPAILSLVLAASSSAASTGTVHDAGEGLPAGSRAGRTSTQAVFLFAKPAKRRPERYDVVIRNGRIVDGTGNPWFLGDVGVAGGRIARIGRIDGGQALRVIDAAGRVVSPGFIDVHTHVEDGLLKHPQAANMTTDGVTSLITGNCGTSELRLMEWFRKVEGKASAVNVGSLVGHQAIRKAVLGMENRAPNWAEQAKMESFVDTAMREGALGFSTGLRYAPANYADTSEVLGLARVAARYGGVFAIHVRNERTKIVEAVEEAIAIARQAHIPVEIAHLKIACPAAWGSSKRVLELMENARAEGIDVTGDIYPYTIVGGDLAAQMRSWALAGGRAEFQKRLADPVQRRRIGDEIYQDFHNMDGFPNLEYLSLSEAAWAPELAGKNIREINRMWKRPDNMRQQVETLLDLIEKGDAEITQQIVDETDLFNFGRSPLVMFGSDGVVPQFLVGLEHPRAYGAAARFLRIYAMEKSLASLEEVIRRMTGGPAHRFGFHDRGLLREGMWADIIVFDPARVKDLATFEKPHQYSRGFDYVLVNGELVVDDGKPTNARPGKVLYGPGISSR